MLRKLLHTALLLLVALFSYADEKSLDRMAFNAAAVNNLFPQERIYLHFDNDDYLIGEDIFFNAYIINPSATKSEVLYTELLSPNGDIIEKKKYKIKNGCCEGYFALKNN